MDQVVEPVAYCVIVFVGIRGAFVALRLTREAVRGGVWVCLLSVWFCTLYEAMGRSAPPPGLRPYAGGTGKSCGRGSQARPLIMGMIGARGLALGRWSDCRARIG